MVFTVESLHVVEKEINSASQLILKATKSSSVTEIGQSTLMKLNKDVLANYVQTFAKLFESSLDLCKSAATEIDKLKSEQLDSQKELIKYQQSQLGKVHEPIKTEMKTFADIVGENGKQNKSLSVKSVKEAVKSATAEDGRSRNFVMFGLPEAAEGKKEDIITQTENVFQKLDYETPYPEIDDAYRLGDKKTGVKRPVKVTLKSSDLVKYLLRRAHNLRKVDGHFSSVYLAPDRSKEERLKHKNLVTEMKGLISKDTSKHYFIRDNRIVSVDKGQDLLIA